jgi:hypothetical protein
MRRINSRQLRAVFVTAAFVLLPCALAPCAAAQSTDASYPSPVFSKEISGRIAPRDVGDPRRTSHFYTFRGTEGDLTVTLDSTELVGDVDVFTATTLRPLIKFTLLGDASHLSKSFYIRSEETLVLRVEARAAGDVDGSYRIQFGGSFEPAPAELANAPQPVEPTVKGDDSRDPNVRRVTSTGARVVEPTPSPTPAEEAAKEPEATPTPSPTPAEAAPESAQPAPARRAAGTRAATGRARAGSSRTRPAAKPPATDTSETKAASETSTQPTANAETNAATNNEASKEPSTPAKTTPATPRRGTRAPRRTAGSESARAGESAAPQPATQPAEPSQRLVIVTKDGVMIQRDMSTVQRVTVEGNQLIVVMKGGQVIRQPMSNVERMSIEP